MSDQSKISTLIITLNPDAENSRTLRSALQQMQIDAAYFPAVDGRDGLPPLESGESIDQQRAVEERLMELTGSEIGCYFSHYRAVKQSYQRGDDYVILLEDDVAVEPDFGDVVRELMALADDRLEIVRFMGLKRHRRKRLRSLVVGHTLVRPVKGICGTQGYMLNRRGMEKVLRHGGHMTKPIDKFYDHFWMIDLQAFCVEPHIVWELPSSSSVKKAYGEKKATTQAQKNQYKRNKWLRSLKRKLYIWTRFWRFYPASKPTEKLGRTARIH